MKKDYWIDTSFLYALFVKNDAYYPIASNAWKNLYALGNFHTSNLVLAELGTLLIKRFDHKKALAEISAILDSQLITIKYSGKNIEESAFLWWQIFQDKKFSYADCVSFEYMKTLRIKTALTFDKDFLIAGYSVPWAV